MNRQRLQIGPKAQQEPQDPSLRQAKTANSDRIKAVVTLVTNRLAVGESGRLDPEPRKFGASITPF